MTPPARRLVARHVQRGDGNTAEQAAVYVRKSREDKERAAHRLEAQREQLPAHVLAQGWQLAGVYDEGFASAARGCALPARDRLEADVRAGRVSLVICCELSRLSRDDTLQDYTRWLALCGDHGVRLATPSRVLDPRESSDWMLLILEGGFSSVEMRAIRARMADGRERAYEAGAWTGGPPPRGYRLERGVPVVVPEEAARVVAVLEEVAAGEALWTIAGRHGLPYQTLHTLTHQRLDHLQARRPSRARPGEWIACRWEPIVTDDLAARVRQAATVRRRGPRANEPGHLLTGGLLVCAYCGHTYTSCTPRRLADGSPVRYYECTSRRTTTRRPCHGSRMHQMAGIDAAVVGHVLGQLARVDDLAGYYQAARPEEADLASLDAQAELLAGQRRRLVDAIAVGLLTHDEAADKLSRLRGDLDRVAARRRDATAARADEPDWAALEDLPGTWADLALAERRELLGALLASIRVYGTYIVIAYRIPLDGGGRTTARVRCSGENKPKKPLSRAGHGEE